MALSQNKQFLSTLARRQRLQKTHLEATFASHGAQKPYKSSRLPSKILVGMALSGIISLLAYRRKSLSRSGVAGAMTAGTTTFSAGSWSWSCAMIFFFVSSSFLSHWRGKEKARTSADKFSKGSQRDLGQVTANGGVATLLAFGYGASHKQPLRDTLEAGYIGALATATADTWGTEIGVLSSQKPRLITTGKTTLPGTSGGITPLGTTASAAGALALGSVFWLLKGRQQYYRSLPLIALLSGLSGSLFDSLLGATAQTMYYCPTCDKETEKHVHFCGTPTHYLRGLTWLNNDAVNFLTTLFGSLVAMTLWRAGFSKRRRSL